MVTRVRVHKPWEYDQTNHGAPTIKFDYMSNLVDETDLAHKEKKFLVCYMFFAMYTKLVIVLICVRRTFCVFVYCVCD